MIVVSLATERSAVVDFKGSHFEREIVLWGVCWYVGYPISCRQLEEMTEERGVEVDHSSLNRCVLKYGPLLDQAFRACKRRVGGSAPITTANWLTTGNDAWTLPVGAQIGRVVKVGGKLPVNFLMGVYYNALRPEYGSTWQLRTQITLNF